MAGVDATVVLGLAGKLDQVFADDGTYRAFPLAPVGLKAGDLSALASDPLGAGARAHAAFSVLVNELPDGAVWQPDGRLLWNVYGEILTGAELADMPRTAAQDAAYRAAFDLLYTVGPGGVAAPSATSTAYEQWRDAYLAAALEYNNRKGAASMSDDPAAAARWAADEPALQVAVDDAASQWATLGHRTEVDQARQVLRSLSTDSPAAAWEGYRRLFDPGLPEIWFRTSTDGLSYVPTGYLPSNVVDVAWPQITVTAAELGVLAGQAPAELRARLGVTEDAGIELVTFEYSYLTVSRPWLAPQVFDSHAWRFPDHARVLSDGGTPPSGECTAFVTGLVLARNITVQHRGPTPTDAGTSGPRLAFVPFARDAMLSAQLWSQQLTTGPAPARSLTAADTLRASARAELVLAPSMRATLPLARLKSSVLVPAPAPAPAPAPDAVTTTTTGPDDVFVMAFQCRLLPHSPDYRPPTDAPSSPGGKAATTTKTAGPASSPRPGGTYRVVAGDTLSSIAKRAYGTASDWHRIYDASRKAVGPNPDRLEVGTILTIP